MIRFLLPLLIAATPSMAQMTDAASVKPILTATKANWVAVRKWDGQDLIYFTHLETWRCALDGVVYGLNGESPETVWELAPCDENNPNALPADYLPYIGVDLDSVQSITVDILYDDGSTDTATYDRASIEIQ